MQDRFRLRFENGERQGEVVVLAGPRTTLGRRPGNTIQVNDSSVSSQHAEFLVEESGVRVRDLGSTNGTRVGGRPLEGEEPLAHGDEVHVGNVRLAFLDAQFDAAAPAPAPASAVPAQPARGTARGPARGPARGTVRGRPSSGSGNDEGLGDPRVHEVSAARLERAEKRSVAGLAGFMLLAGAGAAAGWYFTRGDGGPTRSRPIAASVPGDLLADTRSFERSADEGGTPDLGWEGDDEALTSFGLSGEAPHSGRQGLAAHLAAGEWALRRSPAVQVTAGRTYEALAFIAVDGEGRGRLGIEFESSTGAGRAVSTWSESCTATDMEQVVVAGVVPPGYDRARVLVQGDLRGAAPEATGSVFADDVSLAPAPEGAASPSQVGEYQLAALGAERDALVLFKIDRALASGVRVVEVSHSGEPAQTAAAPGAERRAHLDVTADAKGFAVVGRGLGGATELRIFLEPEVAGDLATLGPAGYRTERSNFDELAVSGCLFGRGNDLVHLAFERPVRVRGRSVPTRVVDERTLGGGFELRAALGGPGDIRFRLQVVFSDERGAAAGLAERARESERAGRLGEAAAAWETLLDEYPFDETLVKQAATERARLVQRGLEDLGVVRAEIERAGFFRLPDLYRAASVKAKDVAERFAGSEVEVEARRLIAGVDELVAELERALFAREAERLREIEKLLESAEMPRLAARVAEYVENRFGADAEGGR